MLLKPSGVHCTGSQFRKNPVFKNESHTKTEYVLKHSTDLEATYAGYGNSKIISGAVQNH